MADEAKPCDGPWIWYPCTEGAILQCGNCGEITVTGNFLDGSHRGTPILREGV